MHAHAPLSTAPAPHGAALAPAQASWRMVALIVVAWTLMIPIVDPRGEFPLNDDWAYALPVQSWIEHGRLRFTAWQSMPLIAQLPWGALFCAPFGFSFAALRMSTWTLGLCGVVALLRLLQDSGVPRAFSALAALSLLCNPVYVALSFGFMTDVPFLALSTLAAIALTRALIQPRWPAWIAGVVLALCATLIRQTGAVLLIAFALAALPAWGFGRRWLAWAVLPMIAVLCALPLFEALLQHTIGVPSYYEMRNGNLTSALDDLRHARLGVVRAALARGAEALCYAGLFLSPVTLAALAAQRARRTLAAVLIGGTALALIMIATGYWVPRPTEGNVWLAFAIGPRMLEGEPAPLDAIRALTTCVAACGTLALVAMFAARCAELGRSIRARKPDPIALFALSFVLLGVAPLALAYGPLFDRHVLSAAPLLALFLLRAPGLPERLGRGAWPAWTLVAAGCAFSLAATHDYFALNRARWALAGALQQRGIASAAIDGGFEYNNYVANRDRLASGHFARGLVERERSRYVLVLAAAQGERVIASMPAYPWLPWAPQAVHAIERVSVH